MTKQRILRKTHGLARRYGAARTDERREQLCALGASYVRQWHRSVPSDGLRAERAREEVRVWLASTP